MRKKLYLVRREVVATSLKRAMISPGIIYSIEVADEKNWPPVTPRTSVGFNKKKK